MHKLPNDLLILHNQPLTAVQPIALSSFQTLHTEKLKVLDKKCIEINSWAGRNLACVSGTFVIIKLGIFFMLGRIFGLLPDFLQFCCQKTTTLLSYN